MALGRYFADRQIAPHSIAPAMATPLRFGDPCAEHLATRRAAGLFDFSFMTCLSIRGAQSADFLERIQVRSARNLPPGQIAYTILCREDGTVIDDATLWRHGADDYWLFVGLGIDRNQIDRIAAAYAVDVVVRSTRQCILSIQGPASFRILQEALPGGSFAALGYYRFCRMDWSGNALWAARLGDGGELGYELVVNAECGPVLWQHLMSVGARRGLLECGFAAADTLRIEAGHILFSRPLAATPYELGLGRLLRRSDLNFIGAEALAAQRFAAPRWRLVGLLPKWLDRDDAPCFEQVVATDAPGQLHSLQRGMAQLHCACVSPVLGRDIALGFVVEEDRHPGTLVTLSNRRTAEVARIPFYDPLKMRPRVAPTKSIFELSHPPATIR
ncbi:MAG: aminomethyltransferase family protein [Sulfuritalea sp.]|nr:aminomethyltransferase family protein [Sulfuritalea sp.]